MIRLHTACCLVKSTVEGVRLSGDRESFNSFFKLSQISAIPFSLRDVTPNIGTLSSSSLLHLETTVTSLSSTRWPNNLSAATGRRMDVKSAFDHFESSPCFLTVLKSSFISWNMISRRASRWMIYLTQDGHF